MEEYKSLQKNQARKKPQYIKGLQLSKMLPRE